MTRAPQKSASEGDGSSAAGFSLSRLWPAAVLALGVIGFFAFGLDRLFTFEAIRENREMLLALVERHGFVAVLGFGLIYMLAVAFSLPAATLLTVLSGFLFGVALGGTIVIIGATLGAIGVFLAARSACGDYFRNRAGPWLVRMEEGFCENATSYLLVLRMVPIFPFVVVNVVPALLGVRLRLYALTTFFGIIPGSLVYASVGSGLGAVFDRGEEPDIGIIFTPEIFGPILGLAVLILIPVLYKVIKRRRAQARA